MLVARDDQQLEKVSMDSGRSPPLLLAVEAGCLDAVQLLISLGADAMKSNAQRQNAVHLAAQHHRVDILRYFVEDGKCKAAFNTWQILADVLSKKSDGCNADVVLSTLIPLLACGENYIAELMEVSLIKVLLNLLKDGGTEEKAAYVIRLISESPEVQQEILENNGMTLLAQLLTRSSPGTNCHAAVILTDLLAGVLKPVQVCF